MMLSVFIFLLPLQVAGVANVCVRAVLDETTGQPESLVAYIVPERSGGSGSGGSSSSGGGSSSSSSSGGGSDVLIREVRQAVAEEIPDYAVPKYWVPMPDGLPLREGESRKMDLSKLPRPTNQHLLRNRKSDRASGDTAASSVTDTLWFLPPSKVGAPFCGSSYSHLMNGPGCWNINIGL